MSIPYEGDSTTQPIPGILGTNSADGDGVFGFANGDGRGVVGVSVDRTGAEGNSTNGAGVWGDSKFNEGVHGVSHGLMAGTSGVNMDGTGPGVWGESNGNDGVHGISHSRTNAGVSGANDQGGLAGFFDGNVVVTGNLSVNGVDVVGSIQNIINAINVLQQEITVASAPHA